MTEQTALDFGREHTAKDAALDSFETSSPALLTEARRIAHALARDGGTVTIEEVRARMETSGSLLLGFPLGFLGSVFLERDERGRRVWTKADWKPSATKGRKCGFIWVWRLAK